MTELEDVLNDLTADGDELDELVAGLDAEQWKLPTPAPGWTIAHQIAHLAFIFRLAGTAAADPEAFDVMTAGAQENFDGAVNAALEDFMDDTPEVLLSRGGPSGAEVVEALAAVPAGQIVPWLVNPLPPIVLACAGIMEQFAHGQDIADALGVRLERTDRLRHLVAFAVLHRGTSATSSHGLTPPSTEFRFEITGPSGALWASGRRTPGSGSPGRRRLLPAGDPAPAPRRPGDHRHRRRRRRLAGHRAGVPRPGGGGPPSRPVRTRPAVGGHGHRTPCPVHCGTRAFAPVGVFAVQFTPWAGAGRCVDGPAHRRVGAFAPVDLLAVRFTAGPGRSRR